MKVVLLLLTIFAAAALARSSCSSFASQDVCLSADQRFHVRCDLKNAFEELLGDASLGECTDLDGKNYEETKNDSPYVYSSHWLSFEQAKSINEYAGTLDATALPLKLWLDGGDDKKGSRASALVVEPLWTSRSLSRRSDTFMILAYGEDERDLLAAFDYLLPQLIALRDQPRVLHGGNCPPALKRCSVIFPIALLIGDHPAICKALGVMISAGAYFPCKYCLLHVDGDTNLGDPAHWEADLRTDEQMDQAIESLRTEPGIDQRHVGVRDEFKEKNNPFLAYYAPLRRHNITMFGSVANEIMHDGYLSGGLICHPFAALSELVLATNVKDPVTNVVKHKKTEFLGYARAMKFENVDEFTATLWRHQDANPSSKNSLLHRLKNESLYAREVQELAPHLLPAFAALKIEAIDQALPYVAKLLAYVAVLEQREYPIDAPDEWWEEMGDAAVEAYGHVRTALNEYMPKSANRIKIHDCLKHALQTKKRHGRTSGVQHLEHIFRIVGRVPTNCRDVGSQVFPLMHMCAAANRWAVSDDPLAKVVCHIVDGTSAQKNRMPGGVDISNLPDNVQQYVRNLGWQGGFVKWIEFSRGSDDYFAQRGCSKAFAAPRWNGSAKYSFLEDAAGDIYRLAGLFSNDDDGRITAVAYKFDFVKRELCQPLLRLKRVHQLCHFDIDPTQTDRDWVTQVRQWHRVPAVNPADLGDCEARPQDGDRFFMQITLNTYGPLRYPLEYRWREALVPPQ